MQISSTERCAGLHRVQSAAGQGAEAVALHLQGDTEPSAPDVRRVSRLAQEPLEALRTPQATAAGIQLQPVGTSAVRSVPRGSGAAGGSRLDTGLLSGAARQPRRVPQPQSDSSSPAVPVRSTGKAQGIPPPLAPPLLLAARPKSVQAWIPSLQTVLWATMVLAPSLAWLPALGSALPSTLVFLSIAGLWLGCGLALWAVHQCQAQGTRAEMLHLRYVDDAAALLAAAPSRAAI
jgi:hypothetical protein